MLRAMMTYWAVAASTLMAGGACDDFATPAELDRTQIIAVRAEPPIIPAGGETELDVFVAGPMGRTTDVQLTWAVTPTVPDTLPLGEVRLDGDRAFYVAPAGVSEITAAAVELKVGADSRVLTAIKAIVIGAPAVGNPVISEVRAAQMTVEDGEAIMAEPNTELALEVVVDPALTDSGQVAWYSTAGEIEFYRSEQTTLLVDDAAAGVVIVVVRNGLGGVAWRQIDVVRR